MKTIFIGRQREIQAIRKLLTGTNKRVGILLGNGGIGKTRFLQVINQMAENEIFRLMWWDFDEYIQKDRPELYIKNKFLDAAGLTEKISDTHDISFTEIATKINNNPKRKLLLFDTLEKLNDPRIKSGLFELFSSLTNSVFIFAGRPPSNEQGEVEFADFIGKAREIDPSLKIIAIKEFDQRSALEYISRKARSRRVFISDSDKKKLVTSSRGIPILLDLATDYLANNISIPSFLTNISNSDFELHLTEQVNKLKPPLDLAVLILSVVSPLDKYSLAKMLDINDQSNGEMLFHKLKTFSFVKVLPDGQIILHDKMEDLIVKHIWNGKNLVPSIEFEEQILNKAFEIFKERDHELMIEKRRLKKKIKASITSRRELAFATRELNLIAATREVVTQKWVRYGFALDPKNMWHEYISLVRDLRTGHKYEFIRKLVEEINEPVFPNREPYWKN